MDASSPLDKFIKWENEIGEEIFLRQPFNGVWKTWTWVAAGAECRKMAAALQLLGLPEGSHIAILSKNCVHWIMADLAIMMAGYVSVPVYPSLNADSIRPILLHSDTKVIIVGKLDDYKNQQAGIPANIITISVAAYGITGEFTWEGLLHTTEPIKKLFNWKPHDILTIIYTSGTTGNAKGVMHAVSAVDAVVQVVVAELKLATRFHLFSYLPLSHVAERLAVEMNGLYNGCTISFSESLQTFGANLVATQPHCFVGVPHIWARFRENILKKIPQKRLNLLLKIPIINTAVKNGLRKKMGLARATTIISGAAPISVELLLWFKKLGINIFVTYGCTEDCVYNHTERPGVQRLGSVGKALPGLQTRLAPDGEIRLKSIGNMKGYYKQPEVTKEAFDEQGYLKTGDMGEYDADGFLFITGRIKDQFKTNKGKYIAPACIELKLQENADIEQCCVVGAGLAQPIALINLSATGKTKKREQLVESLSAYMTMVNPLFESFERIEKLVVTKQNWTIENGLMTPSLKVKRNLVEKELFTFYQQWYNEAGKIVWE